MAAELGQTTDPKALIPGDPGAIADDVRALAGNAATVHGVGGSLGAVDPASWTGPASTAFHASFDPEPAKWSAAARTATGGGNALLDFARTLSQSQGEAARAIALYTAGQAATRAAAHQHSGSGGTGPAGDPGAALRAEAKRILERARSAVRDAGDTAADALAGLGGSAASVPSAVGDLLGDHTRYHGSTLDKVVKGVSDGSTIARQWLHHEAGKLPDGAPLKDLEKTVNGDIGGRAGYLLSAVKPVEDIVAGKDPSKDIASGLVGIGAGEGGAAAAGELGFDAGGPVGAALGIGLYETYKHPKGAGEVANHAVTAPHDVARAVGDEIGKVNRTAGDAVQLGNDLNPLTSPGTAVSGDAAQLGVTGAGHLAQNAGDLITNHLHNDGKAVGDLVTGHPLDAANDIKDKWTGDWDVATHTAGDLYGDGKTFVNQVSQDAPDAVGQTWDDAKDFGGDVVDAGGDVKDTAADVAGDAADGAADKISDGVGWAEDHFPL